MKKKTLLFVLACCWLAGATAQSGDAKAYRNFPIIVSLQFHSLSMPFKDFKSNFSNMGIGLGTELSFNGRQNWVQQVNAVWYRNKTIGNGLFLYTQTAWRPKVVDHFYTEIKLGAGYLMSFRPVEAFQYQEGLWRPAGHKAKGLLALPIGISLGYDQYKPDTYFSPFVSYQFMLVNGYNQSIPLVPETLFQIGSRIHLQGK